MEKVDICNAPKYAGIYCFRNKINGKCYVGQAIKLRQRLLSHWNTINKPDSDNPMVVYKAFRKYGVENFELIIVETIRDALGKDTKKKLDELEKKYIQEYDSYNNGYNSTLGGDGGVLGYKMTPEQIEKIRAAAIENAHRIETILIDINTWEERKFDSVTEAANFLNIDHTQISNRLNGKYYSPICNKYITPNLYDEYLDTNYKTYKEFYTSKYCEGSSEFGGKFVQMMSDEEFIELFNNNKHLLKRRDDIESVFGMCNKTFYNYINRIGLESPLETKSKHLYYVLENTKTGELIKYIKISGLAEYFGIKEASMIRQAGVCKKEDCLYKKIYKIHTITNFDDDVDGELHHYVNTINGHTITTIYKNILYLFKSFNDLTGWKQVD